MGFDCFVLNFRFFGDDWRTNYDVAQQFQPDLFRQIGGKRKYVGGLILVSISSIELPALAPANEPN